MVLNVRCRRWSVNVTTSSELTYPALLLAVFARQVGLPVPAVVFLMAAGALSAHGKMQMSIIIVLGVVGALAADGIWFWLGRQWGSSALRLLCRFSADPRHCLIGAREHFHRYGLRLLCVAKFVPGLDAVAPPLGGAEGVSVSHFFAFDTIGSLLWSGVYAGVGCVFADELELALGWAKHFGAALGILIGGTLVLYAGWRALRLVRMIRRMRLRRITPVMLARKLKSKNKLAVLDLSTFEEEIDDKVIEAIPGAFGVQPSRLRKSPQISIPDDVQIILCSSSGDDIVSARAAMALKRIGVDKAWVLEGGLRAWREKGLPVAGSLQSAEAIAERLGIKLSPA